MAVVSLPAGVFNPYSGVKTSILLLDKALARKTDRIAFFKVENDGFDLGAQRRPIEQNDLPQVGAEVAAYVQRLRAGEAAGNSQSAQTALAAENRAEYVTEGSQARFGIIVEKEKVTADGEYNLSGERYRQQDRAMHSKWETVAIGDICSLMTGGTPKSTVADYYENGTVPWLVSGDIHKMEIRECEGRITEKGVANSNAKYLPVNSVLIALNGQGKTRGTVAMLRLEGATCNQSLVSIALLDEATACPEFIFWTLRSMYAEIRALTGNNERSGLNMTILRRLQIPLPPLDVQREIVAEFEGYQKVIDGARAVVENYRPHIHIDPDWPMVRLGEVCETSSGGTPLRSKNEYYHDGSIPWLRSGEIAQGIIEEAESFITKEGLENSSAKIFPKNTVLVAMYGATAGQVGLLRLEASTNQAICGIMAKEGLIPKFLFHILKSKTDEMVSLSFGGAQPNISQRIIRNLIIPRPPLIIQEQIVAQIEAEQALVDANRELIERFEKKIRSAIGQVWGDTETKARA